MKILLIIIGFLFSYTCYAQNVTFQMDSFKNKLLWSSPTNFIAKDLAGNYFAIDANGDGEIQLTEAAQVSYIKLNQQQGSGVYNLVGINEFPNLTYFSTTNSNLYDIDIHGLQNLTTIDITYSDIQVATLYNLPALTNLSIWYNDLTSLDLTGIPSIVNLNCYNNSITSLDLSMLHNLINLTCYGNQIVDLNLKNGSREVLGNRFEQGWVGSPTLRFLCVDDEERAYTQSVIDMNPGANLVVINDYCTFTPGGSYYELLGNAKIDTALDGCDASDPIYPNLRFNISNGNVSGTFYTQTNGNYNFPVQAGAHTITPELENPSYFNFNPVSITTSFPQSSSPSLQDFCIVPTAAINDLEIIIMPLEIARPGFDVEYKILYKNKGTTTQSGSITLNFQDDFLDIVSVNPSGNVQNSGVITWSFNNLIPMETREIDLVFNLNSPMEVPALNDGDTLIYDAIITANTDTLPDDNSFELQNDVINSYDPNDITCLEGIIIAPQNVGNYVHYMIRFENNGTAPAQNVVIKSVIDTSKFEIMSLVTLDASHNVNTRIKNTNKVEFVFENIMLPFNNALNDGYVVFKIKTKPSLTLGDTFSNEADIYFDFNFPIKTNTFITTIATPLSIDNLINKEISLYPNPVKDFLHINDDKHIAEINVLDMAGRVLYKVNVNDNTVDLNNLPSGNYFINFLSSKGETTQQIIKE